MSPAALDGRLSVRKSGIFCWKEGPGTAVDFSTTDGRLQQTGASTASPSSASSVFGTNSVVAGPWSPQLEHSSPQYIHREVDARGYDQTSKQIELAEQAADGRSAVLNATCLVVGT